MTSSIKPWAIPTNTVERDEAVLQLFPQAQPTPANTLAPTFRGGRQAALIKLNAINGEAYGKTRNFLNGEVTHLSPYFRHGCITLKEAVISVQEEFGLAAKSLLFEFGWREYWRTVWYAYGMAILQELQAPKVALSLNVLPDDIQTGNTGLPCMDSFITELAEVGYLHNHARMWLASYIVHWRDTDWQDAAFWMHDQLLDGDYASNHLSWQWVASTFSNKPYFFNQENLAKYSDNQYCESCSASCPFKDTYTTLEQKLFKPTQQQTPRQHITEPIAKKRTLGTKTIVWVHDEMLNSEHSMMAEDYHKVFVFDPTYYQGWSMNRLIFMADCLAEMPDVAVWVGNTGEVLAHLNTQNVLTQDTPNHHLKQQVSGYPVRWQPEEKVADIHFTANDIKSFSRFWKTASEHFLGVS